jgi:hypothetical protein
MPELRRYSPTEGAPHSVMPEETGPTYDSYQDSLIILADVLGMRASIRDIADPETFSAVASVLDLLREQAALWSSTDGRLRDLRASAISDSLVVSLPFRSSVAATALVLAMHDFQYGLLLRKGRLLRGYMTRGAIYHSSGLLFGDGHLRAFEGEQRQANCPPRIVVDPELIEAARRQGAEHPPSGYATVFDTLRQDSSDGQWFIDYLKPVGLRSVDPEGILRSERARLQETLREQVEAHQKEARIGSKYVWLEAYESASRHDFELTLSKRRAQSPHPERGQAPGSDLHYSHHPPLA